LAWKLARAIDYHERNNWAVIWVGRNHNDEVVVYREWNPSPDKWVNYTIAEQIAVLSAKEHYAINLIDPLANKIQTNTGRTVIQDLNEFFFQLKKRSVGRGGYWEPFDTKGTKGRDDIRRRLRNSIQVEKPNNNKVLKDGREITVPTLWIARDCPLTAASIKKWRYEDWSTTKVLAVKDRKESPAQKWSHFCTALEGILKDNRFSKPRREPRGRRKSVRYFQNR
jgi:hypothetical protein